MAEEEKKAKILEPENRIKKKIGEHVDVFALIPAEVVERAEKEVEKVKDSFSNDNKKDIQNLRKIFDEMKNDMLEGRTSFDFVSAKIAESVLDVKSRAGMCGYPLATEVATSLLKFCNKKGGTKERDIKIIDTHISALETIYRDGITGDGGHVGRSIISELKKI